eukprot:g8068.t1
MMSDKSPQQNSEDVDIEQVQSLLRAVEKSLGGAQDKYKLLEDSFKKQEQELKTANAENAELKSKLSSNLRLTGEDSTVKTVAPFRPSRLIAASQEDRGIDLMEELYIRNHDRPLPKLIKGKHSASCAYCVLVMERDSYSLGAAVVAHRLKKLGTKADTVCMVTKDVSVGAVEALASVFDAVFQVPYLEIPCRKLPTKKQQNYYGQWIERSFTKWNVLALAMYKKVLFMDADMLPMINIDHLFKIKAPAATFSSPWANTFQNDGFHDPYKGLKHGDPVSDSMIKEAVKVSLDYSVRPDKSDSRGSYVGLGSLVLLEPSLSTFGIFTAFLRSQLPFGIPGCHSGYDEQSIVLFYYLQHPISQWTHISQEYNALDWHESWLEGLEIKCYHYLNEKPWNLHPDVYPDLKHWYQGVEELDNDNSHARYLLEICLSDPLNFMSTYYEIKYQTESTLYKEGDSVPPSRSKLKSNFPPKQNTNQVDQSNRDNDTTNRSRHDRDQINPQKQIIDQKDPSKHDRDSKDQSRQNIDARDRSTRDQDPKDRPRQNINPMDRSRYDHDPTDCSSRSRDYDDQSRQNIDAKSRSRRDHNLEGQFRQESDPKDHLRASKVASFTTHKSSRIDRSTTSFTSSSAATDGTLHRTMDFKSTQNDRSDLRQRTRRFSTPNSAESMPLYEDHYSTGESRSSLHVFSSRKKSSSQRFDLASSSTRMDPNNIRPFGCNSPMRRSAESWGFKPYMESGVHENRRPQSQSDRMLHRRFESFGSSSSGGGRSSRSSSKYDRSNQKL